MNLKYFQLVLLLVCAHALTAQVKIGERSEQIDPASLLELESQDKVLVITRLSTSQMESITPLNGALVYNTDESCLFYHNGQRWINLCEALGLAFTNEPIVNQDTTIIITEFEDRYNFEVGQIRGENIVDFSIGSQDIQNNSINLNKLADASVDSDKLTDNAVTAAKIGGDVAGSGLIQNADGALEVDVTEFSGDGTLSSPTGTILLGGTPVNALFEDVDVDVDIAELISGDIENVIRTGTDGGLYVADDQNAAEVVYDDGATGIGADNVQEAIEQVYSAVGGGSGDLPNEYNLSFGVTNDSLVITDGAGSFAVALSSLGSDDQNLTGATLTGTSLQIDIEDGASTTVDLSSLVDDADADPTNEIQDLDLTTNTLTITNNGSATPIDLSPYLDNTDDQTAAEVGIADAGGNFTSSDVEGALAELAAGSTDDQDLTGATLTGTSLQIDIEDGASTTVDLSSLVDDADADPTNENQTVSPGPGIAISQVNQDFEVINTDPDQVVTLNEGVNGNVTIQGIYPDFTIDVPTLNDADNDPENEIELPVGGTNGQVLATDGSGTYTWIENSAAVNSDGTSILGDGVTTPLTVGEISGGTAGNIVDNSLTQEDIGNNAVGESELADQAVTPTKIQPGEDGQVLTTNGGSASWADPYSPLVAWGKIIGGALVRGSGIQSITVDGVGQFTVLFTENRGDEDYTINLSVLGDFRIYVTTQGINSFSIEIREPVTSTLSSADFFVSVMEN